MTIEAKRLAKHFDLPELQAPEPIFNNEVDSSQILELTMPASAHKERAQSSYTLVKPDILKSKLFEQPRSEPQSESTNKSSGCEGLCIQYFGIDYEKFFDVRRNDSKKYKNITIENNMMRISYE
jgi:hypothetical protein